jgi:hypothetical protein
VGWIYALLLAGAVAVLLAAEWPRVAARLGLEGRALHVVPQRRRKSPHLRLVQSESEEFAASVERDLDQLPTTTLDEHDRR